MKKIVYIITVLSIGGIMVSCKEKAKENKIETDSLSVKSDSLIQEKTEEIQGNVQIVRSDFDKIQAALNTKSDTVYITNYWATWCGPCVEEIPEFVALQNEYKDKKVKFSFVNVDKEGIIESEVIPFVQKNKMENVYHMSIEELVTKISSIDPKLEGGIPVTVIQKGTNREGFLGSLPKAFMEEKITEYLNKK